MKEHEPCKFREKCYHIEAGRKGGLIRGPKAVMDGQLARLQADSRRREIVRKIAKVQGRKNVESGLMAQLHVLGGKVQGRRNVESGRLQEIVSKVRKHNGPNNQEAMLYTGLECFGIDFVPEVNLGYGLGICDVLVGKIVGELDGSGHFANFRKKRGVTDEENRKRVLEKDARHDTRRVQQGFKVIRDSDPVRLAIRIKDALI
jgi:hypothetical protein